MEKKSGGEKISMLTTAGEVFESNLGDKFFLGTKGFFGREKIWLKYFLKF